MLPVVCALQGDVELEPSRGAKRSAAVRRMGTSWSAAGKSRRSFPTNDVLRGIGLEPSLRSETWPWKRAKCI